MTNEELVAAIQSGQWERWTELWRQMEGLAWQYIRRWYWAKERAGLELDDFLQASKLALLMAVDSYDPGREARFSTWFGIALKREFALAAGVRTEKQANDPFRGAVSLDAPLTNDEGEQLDLAGVLEDPDAEKPFRLMELRTALEGALSDLPEDQKHALFCRYWLDVPADKKAYNAALRALRHPSRSGALRDFL